MAGGPKFSGDRDRELQKFLQFLEQKLNAPVLNGGFHELFQKVEKIEGNVERIENNVDKLNSAVFDPEKGLFIRVQSEKLETDHDVDGLNTKVDAQKIRIDELDNQLKSYRRFVIGAALSVVTAIVKMLWDASGLHISIH